MIFFLAIIFYGFKKLGAARRASEGTADEKRFWAMGAVLFAHAVAFFGITYFDQTVIIWYAVLAMISTITLSAGIRNIGTEGVEDIGGLERNSSSDLVADPIRENPWHPLTQPNLDREEDSLFLLTR